MQDKKYKRISHYEIKEILTKYKNESKLIRPFTYRYDRLQKRVIICTADPGIMIGLRGSLVEKYQDILKETFGEDQVTGIDFIETHGIIK